MTFNKDLFLEVGDGGGLTKDDKDEIFATISATAGSDVQSAVLEHARKADESLLAGDARQAAIHGSIANSLIGAHTTDDPILLPIVEACALMMWHVMMQSIMMIRSGPKICGTIDVNGQVKAMSICLLEACRRQCQGCGGPELSEHITGLAIKMMDGGKIEVKDVIEGARMCGEIVSKGGGTVDPNIQHVVSCIMDTFRMFSKLPVEDAESASVIIMGAKAMCIGAMTVCATIPETVESCPLLREKS